MAHLLLWPILATRVLHIELGDPIRLSGEEHTIPLT